MAKRMLRTSDLLKSPLETHKRVCYTVMLNGKRFIPYPDGVQ